LGNGSPWANSLANITGKTDNTLENKNLDCDVSSSSSLNSSESYDTVQDSDIYLSDFNETNNDELHKSDSHGQISTATEPVNVDSQIPKSSASPAYHPASQIKLYNKSSHTAALIRLGPFGNLSTVVFDMCFNHHGKKEDWFSKESAAFNIEELILFYGAYRKNQQAKMTLKFHAQTSQPVQIEVNKDKLILQSGQLYLVGDLAQKVKLLALCDHALKVYVNQAFPECSFSEFMDFY